LSRLHSFELCIYTGVRIGEIIAVKQSQVFTKVHPKWCPLWKAANQHWQLLAGGEIEI
jgi:integrase